MPIETDTRILLLDAAERLFAEAGFAATSLRNITAAAGVNLASVNYHFGSKDALLEAVIQRRLGPVNDERLRRLEELEGQAGTEPLNLEKALRCFLEPPFEKMREWGESGRLFMRVVGRIHSDTNPKMAAMFLKQFEETLKRFTSALQRALPQLAPQEVSRRFALRYRRHGSHASVERGDRLALRPESHRSAFVPAPRRLGSIRRRRDGGSCPNLGSRGEIMSTRSLVMSLLSLLLTAGCASAPPLHGLRVRRAPSRSMDGGIHASRRRRTNVVGGFRSTRTERCGPDRSAP